MSSEALRWAWKQDVPSGQKIVLVLMGDYADEEHSLNPRHKWIAKRVGMGISTVRKHLYDLREAGYLRWENEENARGQQEANRYFLAVEEGRFEGVLDSDTPRGVLDSSDRITTSSIASSSSSVRETSSLFLQTPRPGAQRGESKAAARRRAAQAAAAEEAALDPFQSLDALQDEPDAAQEPPADPGRYVGTPEAPRGPQRRSPGDDTSMGLAIYFRDQSMTLGWGAEPANVAALAKKFSEWKRGDLTPETIRLMIDRYVSDEGIRNPRAVPWTDFLAKRALLMDGASREVEAEAAEERRDDEGYWLAD